MTRTQPNHTKLLQGHGFAWVRVQDPGNQVTDHYYSQDDTCEVCGHPNLKPA
ncbi:MAG TPA: hypothetical protein VFR15_11615 [Chloroflexia bacterium]|nr:hypothetical protein [Chloroflexia bacterium]